MAYYTVEDAKTDLLNMADIYLTAEQLHSFVQPGVGHHLCDACGNSMLGRISEIVSGGYTYGRRKIVKTCHCSVWLGAMDGPQLLQEHVLGAMPPSTSIDKATQWTDWLADERPGDSRSGGTNIFRLDWLHTRRGRWGEAAYAESAALPY